MRRPLGWRVCARLVMAGIGIALVPELATRAPFGASQLAVYRRFAPPEPTRHLVLAWRRSFPRGDAFARLGPRAAGGTYFAGPLPIEVRDPRGCRLPAAPAARSGLRDLRRDNTRWKPLSRPLRIERKGSKKCGLHLQNLERTYAPLPRQPNYHLLDPDRAQRLREVRQSRMI